MARVMSLVSVLAVPGVAQAHPQHGAGDSLGLVHFISDPFHLGLTLVAVLSAVALRTFVLRRRAASRG